MNYSKIKKRFYKNKNKKSFKNKKEKYIDYSQRNLYNKKLQICSLNPLTGWFRNGKCEQDKNDYGNHLVCARMSKKFLDFTKSQGNNLYSVVKPGDNWCLCQDRWYEAYINNKAPRVIKKSTNNKIKNHIKKLI